MALTESVERETAPRGFGAPDRWVPMAKVIEMFEAVVADPHTPAALRNTAMASLWLLNVDGFRDAEDQFLENGEYESGLTDHRVFLAGLISEGEIIIAEVKKAGMIAGTKFSLGDLEATINSLHTTFECQHRPGNSQKTNDIIAKLFDGAKS